MELQRALLASIVVAMATIGFPAAAEAVEAEDAALCVGCTLPAQFEAVGKATAAKLRSGDHMILVVNPDTNVSRNVYVTNTPFPVIPGPLLTVAPTGSDQQLARWKSHEPVLSGTVVALSSEPDIYYVDGSESVFSTNGAVMTLGDTTSASSLPVSATERVQIGAAIQLTKSTYVIRLPELSFPTYYGSLPIAVAHFNWSALQSANPGWPITQFNKTVINKLMAILGVYSGNSFKVCAVFTNGDSACYVPDPVDHNVPNQISGSAKDINGNTLSDTSSSPSGQGGGGGMVVINSPPNRFFGAPGAGSGDKWLVCTFVGGKLESCHVETVAL